MGFNFGAALGGFADQVVSDIETQEKDVKLRTRTILDRQTAEKAANKKEYKANMKKTTEQLNSIVKFFGDDPDRWNKARAIVAGGDSHYTSMYNTFTKAQLADTDINQVYGLVPDKNRVGLKTVEDAASSLVQLAEITQPTFGANEQSSSLFGTTSMSKVYAQGRKQYEQAGLLTPVTEIKEAAAKNYGNGIMDLSKIAKDAPLLKQQEANLYSAREKIEDVNSPEYKALTVKINKVTNQMLITNASYIASQTKSTGKTDTELTKSYDMGLKALIAENTDPVSKLLVGDDGKVIGTPEGRTKRIGELTAMFGTTFVNNMVTNNGEFADTDGQRWAKQQGLIKYVKKQDEVTGDGNKVSTTSDKNKEQFKQIKDIVTNKALNSDSAYQLIKISGFKSRDPEKIEKKIQDIYKNSSALEVAKAVNKALARIVEEDTFISSEKEAENKEIQKIRNPPKKQVIDSDGNAPNRTKIVKGLGFISDAEREELKEWDRLYKNDFYNNGKPR